MYIRVNLVMSRDSFAILIFHPSACDRILSTNSMPFHILIYLINIYYLLLNLSFNSDNKLKIENKKLVTICKSVR